MGRLKKLNRTRIRRKVVGHGAESNEDFYSRAHCANISGVRKVADRSEET